MRVSFCFWCSSAGLCKLFSSVKQITCVPFSLAFAFRLLLSLIRQDNLSSQQGAAQQRTSRRERRRLADPATEERLGKASSGDCRSRYDKGEGEEKHRREQRGRLRVTRHVELLLVSKFRLVLLAACKPEMN
jgi:hypothetical protein